MLRRKIGFLASITLVLLVGGIALFVAGVLESEEWRVLSKDGVVVNGVVIDMAERTGRRSGHKYYLTVRYSAEANPTAGSFTKEFSVGKPLYERTRVSSEISVRCLPSDPLVARLASNTSTGQELMLWGAIAAVAGAGFGVAWKIRRDRRLANEERVNAALHPDVLH